MHVESTSVGLNASYRNRIETLPSLAECDR